MAARRSRQVMWWWTSVEPSTTWWPAAWWRHGTSPSLMVCRNWWASRPPMTAGKTRSHLTIQQTSQKLYCFHTNITISIFTQSCQTESCQSSGDSAKQHVPVQETTQRLQECKWFDFIYLFKNWQTHMRHTCSHVGWRFELTQPAEYKSLVFSFVQQICL